MHVRARRVGCDAVAVFEPTPDADDDTVDTHKPLHDTRSARLALLRPSARDVHELFRLYSLPSVWRDDPLLRHASITRTETVVERWIDGWHRHDLGLWVLRSLHGPLSGHLIGVGGCNLLTEVAWNLAFTLRPEVWGQGYAQEVANAGIRCARFRRPELPITAVVAERNTRSQRAVERAGLVRVGCTSSEKHPDPTAALLLYADRAMSQKQVQVLTA